MTFIVPTPEVQALIRQANNENVETRDASVEAIKEWLAQQPHLPKTWDEYCIINFLRNCSYSHEKTKRKLDLYFTMRTAVPEIFANRNIKEPELQAVMKKITVPPLPTMTPDGKRVVVFRAKEKSEVSMLEATVMKINLMIGDLRMAQGKFGAVGDVYIFDTHAFTPAHLARINIGTVKKFLISIQLAYPIKVKEIHVVNAHYLANVLYNWFKPFLKEKIRKRIHFHTDGLESLYKFVPKNILPEEYGGTAGKLQDLHDEWMKKLEEYAPWFQEQENLKADESKRPGKPTNYDDLFGLDGSFRQLPID